MAIIIYAITLLNVLIVLHYVECTGWYNKIVKNIINRKRQPAVVSHSDPEAIITDECRSWHFGSLMSSITRLIINWRLIGRYIYTVTKVMTEWWLVENLPASIVSYIHTVVLIKFYAACIHHNIAYRNLEYFLTLQLKRHNDLLTVFTGTPTV